MKLNPAAFAACLARIAARGKINPKESLDLLQSVASRAEQMRATGQVDPFVTAAGELADKVTAQAKQAKLDALRNAAKRTDLMGAVVTNGGVKNAAETIRAALHGTYKTSLNSVQAAARGLASTWQGVLAWKLRAAGVEKAAISGIMDEDVSKDLWELNGGGGGGSGNMQAKAVADAIYPIMNQIKDRLNAAGANIGTALDYVTRTRHDPMRMLRAAGSMKGDVNHNNAFQAWWDFTAPRLSQKTFADVAPRDGETMADAQLRFGRSAFDALVSGIHMTADGATKDEFVPPSYEGTRNLARKVSQPRVLLWKDATSWNDYMQKFGAQTSLTQGVMQTIAQGARQIALMDRFGTNPMANLNQVMREIEEKYRSQDLDGTMKFTGQKQGLTNVMAYLDGSSNIPMNADWARIGQNIRTLYAVWDLGGVGVTHFASIWPTVTSELKHHNISRLETVGQLASALVKGRGSAERQEILSDLGAYSDGLARDMQANWQPDTPIPGRLSGMANTFMKYTGIHYVFDNTQAAVRSMLSHNLARNMPKSFNELEPHLQQMLGSYGIGEPEWDTLRSATGLKSENGRAYLTPRDAMNVDPSGALADKLMGYYSDTAAHSTVTAGARERALLLGGTNPGTGWGEAARFLTQFKMWPVAAYDQLLRREIYMSTSKSDAAWSLGSMMALSMAAGYGRMAVSDLAQGNPVRNPLDIRTALAGLAQGGGMGIVGDFLFGEAMRSRFGSGLLATAGGPLATDLDSLIHIYGEWTNGKAGWPDLARFGERHIPFANLVYLKGTLDYMLMYHLLEAASPGWWERSNRRIQKETGRTMTGYTPGGGVPYGVPGVYLQNRAGQTSGLLGGAGR